MRTFFVLPLLLSACGASVDPGAQNDSGTVVTDTGNVAETAPVATRTLETGSLLPGPAQNMILDWTFREQGWGSFLVLPTGTPTPATVPVRILTDSPGRASAPVAQLKDPTGTDDKSKAITATCVLVGGKGPFDASVWFSRSTFAGAPVDWDDTADLGSASITTDGPVKTGKTYPLVRDVPATRKVGDRTGVRFSAHIDDSLATAFFVIQSAKNGALWVTAPSIVPAGLVGGDTTTKSYVFPTTPRAPTAAELAAISDYARLVKPKLVPAKAAITPGSKPQVAGVAP